MIKAFEEFYKELDFSFVGYVRCIDIATSVREPMPQKAVGQHWEAPMMVTPHIHALVLQRPKNSRTHVKHDRLVEAWARAMGATTKLHVHVDTVRSTFSAMKYAAKELAWPTAEVAEDWNYMSALATELHGLRLIAPGGVLRKAQT